LHSFWDGGSELQAILVKQQTERIAYFFGREVVTSMVLAILVKQQMGGTSSEDGRVQSSWHATPASRQTPALGRRALDVRAHEIVQLSVPGWRTRQACQLPTSIHGKPGWAAATAAAVAATARDQPRQAQQGPGHAGACHPGHCAGVPRAGILPG